MKTQVDTTTSPVSDPKESSLDVQASMISHPNRYIEGIEALANLSLMSNSRDAVNNYITQPLDVKTPPEKVKKRPDGFDYVESSYMDYQTKKFMPLYEYKLLHVSIEHGWINVIISLKDRITNNIELGADSARIQVRRDAETPSFRDIIDMGNNLKSALSKAIKNAQSRFGIAADVYQKRESVPTDDERTRFEQMAKTIKSFSPTRARVFEESWASLGTDWSEFLDKWQVYVDRNKPKEAATTANSVPVSL